MMAITMVVLLSPFASVERLEVTTAKTTSSSSFSSTLCSPSLLVGRCKSMLRQRSRMPPPRSSPPFPSSPRSVSSSSFNKSPPLAHLVLLPLCRQQLPSALSSTPLLLPSHSNNARRRRSTRRTGSFISSRERSMRLSWTTWVRIERAYTLQKSADRVPPCRHPSRFISPHSGRCRCCSARI
jgi:hypothetical protein